MEALVLALRCGLLEWLCEFWGRSGSEVLLMVKVAFVEQVLPDSGYGVEAQTAFVRHRTRQ